MSNSQARIHELETALMDVIAYLQRLPLNIETGRVARKAQEVLDSCQYASIQAATLHTSAGIPLINVVVQGDEVTLECPLVGSYAKEMQLQELCRKLALGITLNLADC